MIFDCENMSAVLPRSQPLGSSVTEVILATQPCHGLLDNANALISGLGLSQALISFVNALLENR